jgi:hypothetical protein
MPLESLTAKHTMAIILVYLIFKRAKENHSKPIKHFNSKHVATCKYILLTEDVKSDVLSDWLPHAIGGGALIHSGLMPVCLLNRNTRAFHSLLTRWQQVILKQSVNISN